MIMRVGDRVHAFDLLGEPVEGDVIERIETMPAGTWQVGEPIEGGPSLFVRDDVTGVVVLVKESRATRRTRIGGRR